jgi:5-methylcytosine-specific restriction endonuclease McrA
MKPNRTSVHQKYNGHCAYCGVEIAVKDMQVDHVICQANYEWHLRNNHKIPSFLKHLTMSDLNHIDNLMPSCRSCNNFKKTFSIETFRGEVEEQIKRLRSAKPTFRLAERFGLIECKPKPIVFYFETWVKQKGSA